MRIRYVEAGSGEPVVLAHGFTRTLEGGWMDTGVFDNLAEDYRVIAFDHRGHGKTQLISGDDSTASTYWGSSVGLRGRAISNRTSAGPGPFHKRTPRAFGQFRVFGLHEFPELILPANLGLDDHTFEVLSRCLVSVAYSGPS